MSGKQIPFRHIHLDYHNSAAVGDIAQDFDAEQFTRTLKDARVNSVNVFAKCVHGYSYYPTKVGAMHPGLKFDLLGAQLDGLHRAGIRAPIYLCVKWDDLAAEQHPEWLVIRKDGTAAMRQPLTADSNVNNVWGWSMLDVATDYADYVVAQVEELCDSYAVDGFWLDICFTYPNYSPWAQAQMRAAGVDLADDAAVWAYARAQDQRFFARVNELVARKAPDATLYFNGTVDADMRRMLPYQTHFEIESLPTAGHAWGYMHYPVFSRQVRSYGRPFIGMTGRFQKSWGDFGGLKTTDQLEYECATVLAAGGRVCVGDQLHPNGILDAAVYRRIGRTFARIEQMEPWLQDAQPVAEVAVLAPAQPTDWEGVGTQSSAVEGAAQIFLESGIQFDIIDRTSDFTLYGALVLPESLAIDSAVEDALRSYLAHGGKLIISGAAPAAGNLGSLSEAIPVIYGHPAPTVPTYLWLDAPLADEPSDELAADYDYVFYDQAHCVQPKPSTHAHGDLRAALFNRTWRHFMSHIQAAVGKSLHAPLAVWNDQVLYFAADFFTAYRNHDYWVYRTLVINVLQQFLPPRALIPQAPGWAEFSLHTQAATANHPLRQIVQVVCYQPRRTHQVIPHTDMAADVAGLVVQVRTPQQPARIYLAPSQRELPFAWQQGYATVALPPVRTHAVLVIE